MNMIRRFSMPIRNFSLNSTEFQTLKQQQQGDATANGENEPQQQQQQKRKQPSQPQRQQSQSHGPPSRRMSLQQLARTNSQYVGGMGFFHIDEVMMGNQLLEPGTFTNLFDLIAFEPNHIEERFRSETRLLKNHSRRRRHLLRLLQ